MEAQATLAPFRPGARMRVAVAERRPSTLLTPQRGRGHDRGLGVRGLPPAIRAHLPALGARALRVLMVPRGAVALDNAEAHAAQEGLRQPEPCQVGHPAAEGPRLGARGAEEAASMSDECGCEWDMRDLEARLRVLEQWMATVQGRKPEPKPEPTAADKVAKWERL